MAILSHPDPSFFTDGHMDLDAQRHVFHSRKRKVQLGAAMVGLSAEVSQLRSLSAGSSLSIFLTFLFLWLDLHAALHTPLAQEKLEA